MKLSKIDLYSTPFSFYIGGQQQVKGTVLGSIFTVIVIVLTFSYFIYLFQQYLDNEIEPIYRAQSIIYNNTQSIDINSNMYAYQIKAKGQKSDYFYTYLVINGLFMNSTHSHTVKINTQQCQDTNLEDFQCIDQIEFTNQSQKEDINNINYNYKLTEINFSTINCYDQGSDTSQCAPQESIDEILNKSQITIKLSLSHYNIYMQKMEQSYQTVEILTSADQEKITNIKLQKQIIEIKKGLFIQSEEILSSPFGYQVDNQSLYRKQQPIMKDNSQNSNKASSKNQGENLKYNKQELQEKDNKKLLYSESKQSQDQINQQQSVKHQTEKQQNNFFEKENFIIKSNQNDEQDQKISKEIDSQISHYEQQFTIANQEELQVYYFQKFLDKCYDKQKINDIDRRILNSLSKSYFS
ncbi:hypothetical protein ABPG74_016146 [Tetrahymena malaccensis]